MFFENELNDIFDKYEQDGFKFSYKFIKKIRKQYPCWKNDWRRLFERMMTKIKNGEGIQIHGNEYRITKPAVPQKYMTIKFEKKINRNFCIMDIEFDDIKK